METVKNAANYVSGTPNPHSPAHALTPFPSFGISFSLLTWLLTTDKTSEALNTASKETNKEVAKDSNVGLGDRASAAKDAVGDSLSEVNTFSTQCKYVKLTALQSKDKASAESNKQKATH